MGPRRPVKYRREINDPPNGPGPGVFPEQGGPSSHRNTAAAHLGLKLVFPPPLGRGDGRGNVGGKFEGGGGVRLEEK